MYRFCEAFDYIKLFKYLSVSCVYDMQTNNEKKIYIRIKNQKLLVSLFITRMIIIFLYKKKSLRNYKFVNILD
jgi:hypothetical protein